MRVMLITKTLLEGHILFTGRAFATPVYRDHFLDTIETRLIVILLVIVVNETKILTQKVEFAKYKKSF